MKTAIQILKQLLPLKPEEYLDGDSIGKTLDITRSAVSKNIKKLTAFGVEIESIKSVGYRLTESLILLETELIKPNLNNANINLEILSTTESTNSYIKNKANRNCVNVALAEMQTAGRGRLNREWDSPFGKNIYLSLDYVFNKDISELSGLSQVVAIAIYNTIAEFIPSLDLEHIKLKWPNDVFYKDKKISGVLIELSAETNGIARVIIGIGINVNTNNNKWLSLKDITGTTIDRNLFASKLVNNTFELLETFNSQGFSQFKNIWQSLDLFYNKKIEISNFGKVTSGICKGIDNTGRLLLQTTDSSTLVAVSAGDARIKL